jgi:hypothetical protein
MSTSYSFLVNPLMAAGALAVILLLCRWVFSTSHREARPGPAPLRRGGDYGLLVPVVTARTRADAEALRELLREAGIRATVAADADGADLLVFRADALRARELVG